jgi:tetratricopeptide (TPR) repeat protein
MKTILSLLLTLVLVTSFAQNKKKQKAEAVQPAKPAETEVQAPVQTPPPPQEPQLSPITEHFLRKYSIATRWNDPDVARDALYDVITENPQNDSLIYSLALSYYDDGKYASAVLISQDLLVRNQKNLSFLELCAASFEGLGLKDKALPHYETMYLLSNSLSALYKMAFLQYDLKRFAECKTNLEILLSKTDLANQKVVFNDAQNNQKEYPMKVSVLNLKGMIAQEEGNKPEAKKLYTEALALAADFLPAKQGLAKLK